MYTSQQASYKALPNSTRSRRASGNHSSSRPSLQHAVYRPSTPAYVNSSNAPVAPPTPLASSGQTGPATTAGAGIGITLQSWALSQYQVAQQQQPTQQAQQAQRRPNSVVFQAPNYHYVPPKTTTNGFAATATPMATPRQQSSPYRGAAEPQDDMGVQFAVADYFDPYQSNNRGQTVDVDAAVASAAARGNGGPLARQQGKDHHRTAAATPPSPVMRATRHSRPSTPTSPVSPTGASPRTAQLSGSQLLLPSAQSSIDSLRASANGGTPVASRTMQQNQAGQFFPPQTTAHHHHLRTTASSTAAFNTPPSQSLVDPNAIAAAARMKPRSHTSTDSMEIEGTGAKAGLRSSLLDVVRPIRPPPLPFSSRPRVSSMYDTGAASDPLFGESRARKAESPTKLDLGSSVAASSAGDLTSTTQRPIARPKNFKQQQPKQPKQQPQPTQQQPQPTQQQPQPTQQQPQPAQQQPQPIQQQIQPLQQQPQPIQKQLQPLQQQRDRVVGPADKSGSYGSSETKKSNLIEFIEQQRQQHQAKMSAAQTTHAPRVAAQAPAGISRSEAPGKLTSRSDSTGSMQSDSSERSFKRSTARLVEVDLPVASAAHKPPISAAEAPGNIDYTTSRAAKHSSWYGNNTQPRTDLAAPLGSTDPTYDPVIGLPVSTRLQPRVRAYSHTPPEPSDVPGIGGIRTRNSNDSLGSCSYSRTPRATAASEPLLPPPPPSSSKGLKRNTGGRGASPAPNPYSRNPRHLSVAVQTDNTPPKSQQLKDHRSTASRGVQTDPSAVIHGDDAVLDLMRQMDVQRSTHAVQITEYQEQVIDLELFNQDLATEIDQLTERLTGREKEHVHAIDELRSRLDAASQRADREIGEVKEMHATKCNELAAQVSMLLSKCQRYRQRLVDVGVSEDELLQLGTQEREESSKSQRVSSAEQLQIADLAFIEKQYIETRESSQEADYFKQLMDIERSMENTTMALGFELKRTQAKYLEQAADFIRDQMARLQVETTRSESRLTRALSLRAPGKNAAGLVADLMQQEQRPPLPPMATVVANNAQSNTAAGHRRIAGPDPGNSNDAGAEIAEIVSVSREDLEAASAAASEQVAAAALRRGRQASPVAVEPAQRTEENAHDLLASADRLPVMSRQRSSSMAAYPEHHQVQQRWATVSNALGIRRSQHTGNLAVDGSTGAVARGFQSESRTSGLSRMINAAAARSSSSSGGPSRLAEQQPAPMAVGSDVEGNELVGAYLSSSNSSSLGSSNYSSGSPRRHPPHRSPLSNIASGFFTASIDSMVTSTTIGGGGGGGGAEAFASLSASASALGLVDESPSNDSQLNTSNGTLVAATPSKPQTTAADILPAGARPISMVIGNKSGSLGYFSGHRKMHETSPSLSPHSSSRLKSHGSSGDDVLGSSFGSFKSLHWPRTGERKSSRSNSVIDSQDMTAEELLESLKLPPTGSMGTSSRPGSSYGSSPSPGGSLGRHSPLPLPRTSSFSDVGSRTLPSSTTTRFSSAVFSESPASDSTLMSNAFTTTSFNPKAEININLGLDNSTAQGTASSAASRRGANSGTGSRRLGNRRRSRSICVWERR